MCKRPLGTPISWGFVCFAKWTKAAFNGPNSLKTTGPHKYNHKLSHQLTNINIKTKNTLSLLWRGLHIYYTVKTHYQSKEKRKEHWMPKDALQPPTPTFLSKNNKTKQTTVTFLAMGDWGWGGKSSLLSPCFVKTPTINIRGRNLGERCMWLLVTNYLEWHPWRRELFLLIVLLALQKMAPLWVLHLSTRLHPIYDSSAATL